MKSNAKSRRTPIKAFPVAVIEQRLRIALSELAEDTAAIREPWEPELDSLAVVNVISEVESVLPDLVIAPEKVVRKGGYSTVDEATKDITTRIHREWNQRHR